ncbi:hypothetical protein MLD38_021240 [Melastoma candidum]|uniref:Uncharacterized protein n=1 Tax=Melastoma candidum TaxID=119954 RepID=A0ACB9QIW6_9MYRT|nr:hypothetical protein MLD38_021240 [Melastoma candidum]
MTVESLLVEAEKTTEEVMDAKLEEEVDDSKVVVDKCSSYREDSNFLSDLKEFERKALNDFKARLEEAIIAGTLLEKVDKAAPEEEEQEKVPESDEEEKCVEVDVEVSIWGVPLLPSKGHEGTDVVLLKFLRAREFKVGDAFEMLEKTLRWRKEQKVESGLHEDDELSSKLSSAGYLSGVDREGHPICYNVYGAFATEELYQAAFGSAENRQKFLKWRVQLMEEGIRKLDLRPGGVSSLLQVNDLRNAPGPSKKNIRIATKEAIELMLDNYPEFVARNIFINVPFWYYAFNTILSPFFTQRSRRKFVVARPSKVTETLLKYIPAEEIPIQYGGLKRDNDFEFSADDGTVSELSVKAGSTEVIEVPLEEVGKTLVWDITVLGWEVNYKEEFVPSDEGSYSVIVQKSKKVRAGQEPIRNTFRNNEPGKLVITVDNSSNKKKRVLYRYKTKKCSSF